MHSQYIILALSVAAISLGLPLESIQKRGRPYSIVNVDGGSTAPPSPARTTIIEEKTQTETVKVTHAAPTVTVVDPAPAPAPTTSSTSTKISSASSSSSTPLSSSSTSTSVSSSQSLPSSSPIPTSTPGPTFVTVTVTESESVLSTRYYDDGMWHTLYPIKTFENDVLISSTSSCTTVPTSEPSA